MPRFNGENKLKPEDLPNIERTFRHRKTKKSDLKKSRNRSSLGPYKGVRETMLRKCVYIQENAWLALEHLTPRDKSTTRFVSSILERYAELATLPKNDLHQRMHEIIDRYNMERFNRNSAMRKARKRLAQEREWQRLATEEGLTLIEYKEKHGIPFFQPYSYQNIWSE